jgi:hypothetical protein
MNIPLEAVRKTVRRVDQWVFSSVGATPEKQTGHFVVPDGALGQRIGFSDSLERE